MRFHRHNNVYLLPNLITTAGLFCGFYAIIAALNGDLEKAVIAILIAAVFDALDGRVARLTKSATNFGAEYDSLADMVSFGVAPAMVMFSWQLSGLGNLGWISVFLYTACTALRLARFNLYRDTEVGFTGLPSPLAAILVVTSIWIMLDFSPQPLISAWLLAGGMILLGGLMIANIPYWSPKRISLHRKTPFTSLVVFVLMLALIAIDPPKVLWISAVIYAISGPIHALWRWLRHKVTGRSIPDIAPANEANEHAQDSAPKRPDMRA